MGKKSDRNLDQSSKEHPSGILVGNKPDDNVHDLKQAMDAVKNAQAERDDVVVELHQTRLTKLEMLAKDLHPVFDEVPQETDPFEFALARGQNPRLWIDATTHVRVNEGSRLFELVKDTRNGRTILYSHKDREKIGKVVTDYVAERLLERERMIEGDWMAMRGYSFDVVKDDDAADVNGTDDIASKEIGTSGRKRSFAFLWFLLGMFIAAAGLLAWAWFGDNPTMLR